MPRGADARVEAAAKWLYERIVVKERGVESEWPPEGRAIKYGPLLADNWRDEAREFLAALQTPQADLAREPQPLDTLGPKEWDESDDAFLDAVAPAQAAAPSEDADA
jgi:hypothetical protein